MNTFKTTARSRSSIALLALLGSIAVASSAAAQQAGPTTTTASAPDERGLCSRIADGAQLWLEEIPGGVALLATPKPGVGLSSVRAQMNGLYEALTPNGDLSAVGGEPIPAPPTNNCALFDAGRLGVRVDTAEDPQGARILITSADPDVIDGVRTLVRDFVTQRGSNEP